MFIIEFFLFWSILCFTKNSSYQTIFLGWSSLISTLRFILSIFAFFLYELSERMAEYDMHIRNKHCLCVCINYIFYPTSLLLHLGYSRLATPFAHGQACSNLQIEKIVASLFLWDLFMDMFHSFFYWCICLRFACIYRIITFVNIIFCSMYRNMIAYYLIDGQ